MKSKALRLVDSLITDETTMAELEVINYIKRLIRADNGVKKENDNEAYIRELFEKFYSVYVRKGGKEQAYKTWRKKLIKIKNQENILTKARKIATLYNSYVKDWVENSTEKRFIPMCSSWLNANVPD